MKAISRLLLMALLMAMTILAASCTEGASQGPAYLTAAETADEYRAEAAGLDLAPGFGWPATPILGTAPDGAAMVYEPGFGRQAANHYWYCTWARTAVTADAAQRDVALAEAMKIKDMYYYTDALAFESRPFFDQVLASAELGDLSGLSNDVNLNCVDTLSG